MIDLELTAMNSARQAFPNIVIKGGLFHLNQSLWKKLQELGLASQYMNTGSLSIRKSIYSFMALAFIPENEIIAIFEVICSTASNTLGDFMNYYGRTYIGVYKNADDK
jgi:hypothetical protein